MFKFNNDSAADDFKPSSTCRRFLSPLRQTTFDNNETKGETPQNDQFIPLPHCFQHCSVFIASFIEIYYSFAKMISWSSATDVFLYVGKGLKHLG